MDGARFREVAAFLVATGTASNALALGANAVVRLGATPAQMTWQSGVDVLSFGITKAGALAALEKLR